MPYGPEEQRLRQRAADMHRAAVIALVHNDPAAADTYRARARATWDQINALRGEQYEMRARFEQWNHEAESGEPGP